ncbi:hypothetical protein WJX82_001429 [Trebouxia sp. C0006]
MCNDLIVACIWTIQTYIQHAGYHESVVFMAVVACYSTALMMLACQVPMPSPQCQPIVLPLHPANDDWCAAALWEQADLLNQIHASNVEGIRDFWVGQPSGTGMGRTLQRALQFAEDSNYNSVFEELRTVCTP